MLENNDNINFTFLLKFFLKNKIKIITLSLLTTLVIVFSINFLNTKYKLNHFKFSYKQLDETISYRKGNNFYTDLISGKKIMDLIQNYDLKFNINISVPNTIPFIEVIHLFTDNYIEELKNDEKYKNLNFVISNKKDRSFSNTLIIKSEDINFNEFKKEIIDSFNNNLNNHLNDKIKFLFQIINFQLDDKVAELEKANLYLLSTNKKTKTTNSIEEKLDIIADLSENLENIDINVNLGDFNEKSKNNNLELITFIEEGIIQRDLEEHLKKINIEFSNNPLFKIAYYEKNTFKLEPFFVSLYAYLIYFIFVFLFYIFVFAYIEFFKSR